MTHGLNDQEREALQAFDVALSNPEALLDTWRSRALFQEADSTGLRIRVGAPDAVAVKSIAGRYAVLAKQPFPPLLQALLSRWNGLALEENRRGKVELVREPAVRESINGLFAAERLQPGFTTRARRGTRFGVAFAQCPLIVLVEGPVIFEDGNGPAVEVAKDLADFIRQLAAQGLSADAVVAEKLDQG